MILVVSDTVKPQYDEGPLRDMLYFTVIAGVSISLLF